MALAAFGGMEDCWDVWQRTTKQYLFGRIITGGENGSRPKKMPLPGLKKMNEEHNHKYLVDLIDKLASKLSKKEKSKILDKPIKPKYFKR